MGLRRVFVLTGAGISAESGIPTFRGKDGYWRNLDPMQLATPDAFGRDPELVWEWYRERRQKIRGAKPNPAHDAIARLSTQAREFLLVTQNVDDLHARAGMPAERMAQIHGDIFRTRCSRCDCDYDYDYDHEQEQEQEQDKIPKCPKCGAFMRPGVVWFGEQLDPRQIDKVEEFLAQGPCDCVLVVGTTATFGYIIDWAVRASRLGGELIEVNPEPTSFSRFATRVVREPAAVALPGMVEQIINR